jgi:hypothetical protein
MANTTRTLIVICTLLGVISSAHTQSPANDKVVKFCKDHLGQKIGGGECSHLAEAALKYASAKPRTAFKGSPGKADYVWGKLVYILEAKDGSLKETKTPGMDLRPGDILQFRDAQLKGKNLNGFATYAVAAPHHTAIVVAIGKKTGILTVIEQNMRGEKVVANGVYRLTDLKGGWVRAYRPVSK